MKKLLYLIITLFVMVSCGCKGIDELKEPIKTQPIETQFVAHTNEFEIIKAINIVIIDSTYLEVNDTFFHIKKDNISNSTVGGYIITYWFETNDAACDKILRDRLRNLYKGSIEYVKIRADKKNEYTVYDDEKEYFSTLMIDSGCLVSDSGMPIYAVKFNR